MRLKSLTKNQVMYLNVLSRAHKLVQVRIQDKIKCRGDIHTYVESSRQQQKDVVFLKTKRILRPYLDRFWLINKVINRAKLTLKLVILMILAEYILKLNKNNQ